MPAVLLHDMQDVRLALLTCEVVESLILRESARRSAGV